MPYADKDKQRAFQRDRIATRRAEWIAANGPCRRCGSKENLEIDHRDRNTKVSHRVFSWSKTRMEAELAKCQVLCSDCHKKKTSAERVVPLIHGTSAGYSSGCRCPLCTEAQRVYMERYRRGELGGVRIE